MLGLGSEAGSGVGWGIQVCLLWNAGIERMWLCVWLWGQWPEAMAAASRVRTADSSLHSSLRLPSKGSRGTKGG